MAYMIKGAVQKTSVSRRRVALEFPELSKWLSNPHNLWSPRDEREWEDILRIAQNSAPIIDDLRSKGFALVWIAQYTPPQVNLLPLYETLIQWLPDITDPATLGLCLSRLLGSDSTSLVKRNRESLLVLARDWYSFHKADTPSVLAQCLMRAVVDQDVPTIIGWLNDRHLSKETRANFALDLQRFANKQGIARAALLEIVNDPEIGGAAVWALAGALKSEALPLLLELRETSPHALVRKAAAGATKKVESFLRGNSRASQK
jgi:hypothetical protein